MTTQNYQAPDPGQVEESTCESGTDDKEQVHDSEETIYEGEGGLEIETLSLEDHMPLKPLKPKLAFVSGDSDETKELVEEIAEDMLHFMERLKNIGTKQDRLTKQAERLHQALQENERRHVIELDKLRRELLGERKALATRNAFNAIVPTLDSLRLMRNRLPESKKNAQIRAQLLAVISSLKNIIQTLGFVEFEVETGSVFDPSQVECLGYVEGEPNLVIEVVRSGYKVENVIIRPCGVLIAQPFG